MITAAPMSDAHHYRLLRYLETNPRASQRELAQILGISVGSTHYCVRALIEKGWVKMQNFRKSGNKLAYAYLLTPEGVAAKTRLTLSFLERKRAEYEALKTEIEQLAAELERTRS